MQNFNYTQAEAQALVGSRFETTVEWDQVAKGRRGSVISSSGVRVWASEGSYENYDVTIEWDRLRGQTPRDEPPLQRRFSKFQMETFMRAAKS